MTEAKFRRTLVGAAIATALGLLGDPATAAPYRGAFDPPSFFGEFTINVSPDCLAQENGWYANEVESICDATLLSAIAEVHPPNTYDGVLTFGPVSSQSQLFGLYILDGNIDSFDTALIHHASGVPDPSPQEFWIQFVSGQMPPPPCEICIAIDPTLRGVYLYGDEFGAPVDAAQFVCCVVDLAVPEPGTMSLLLGSLGAGWLAGRRRKERVPDPN